jgi:ethanolamine transporter EutH
LPLQWDVRYDSAVSSIAIIVVGVLTLSALLGWTMLRGMTSAERAERDPKYRRRFRLRVLFFQIGICVAGAVLCVLQLMTRQPPQQIVSTFLMVVGPQNPVDQQNHSFAPSRISIA